MAAKLREQVFQIMRQRRFKAHALAGARVIEAQACRVQELTLQQPLLAKAVDAVADNRTVDECHVDANLVGAPGEQVDADEGFAIFEALDDRELGQRRFALARDCHLLAVNRIAVYRRGDAPGCGFGRALQQGNVGLFDDTALELLHQAAHGEGVAGDDNQPAGVFVEAVDDAAPFWGMADLGDFRIAGEDRVDERSRFVATARMHDLTGGLVDDGEIGVLIDHVERDVFRLDVCVFLRGRDDDGDRFAALELKTRFDGAAVDGDQTILDQVLDLRTGELLAQMSDEGFIEALARLVGGELELLWVRHGGDHSTGAISRQLSAFVPAEGCRLLAESFYSALSPQSFFSACKFLIQRMI